MTRCRWKKWRNSPNAPATSKTAMDAALRAGDLFLNQRDTDKALENWVRVTKLNPEHAIAHSRLAQVHEKLGHTQQAVTEYLAIASIIQRAGNTEKTTEMVNKALPLMPEQPRSKTSADSAQYRTTASQTIARQRRDGSHPHGTGKTTAKAQESLFRAGPDR